MQAESLSTRDIQAIELAIGRPRDTIGIVESIQLIPVRVLLQQQVHLLHKRTVNVELKRFIVFLLPANHVDLRCVVRRSSEEQILATAHNKPLEDDVKAFAAAGRLSNGDSRFPFA